MKQKVWNEAENRERDWGARLNALRACEARALRARKTLTPRFTDFFTVLRKKPTVLQSGAVVYVGGWLTVRGTQREYSSKPLKHSIVERILVFER